MIPVVLFACNDEHEPLIGDIAERNKSLFNLDGVLKEEIHRQTFSQWLLSGVSAEELTDAEVVFSARKFLCVNKTEVKGQLIAADVSQAESIRKTIEMDVAEIYRLAGLKNPSLQKEGGAESGVALKLKSDEMEMIASAIADQAEKSENHIVDLWMAGMGGVEVQYAEYPESFSTEDLAYDLDQALKVLNGSFQESLKAMVRKDIAGKMFPEMTTEEQAAIDAEAEIEPEPAEPEQQELPFEDK